MILAIWGKEPVRVELKLTGEAADNHRKKLSTEKNIRVKKFLMPERWRIKQGL